jgi:hypothetical protein
MAKEITLVWLNQIELGQVTSLGLPEVDDRYHVWRVPLLSACNSSRIGEVVIDAYTTEVLHEKTTKPEMLETRLLKKNEKHTARKRKNAAYPISTLRKHYWTW